MGRVILHCDLNNFYASVECLYNPEIRNLPVAVCGSIEERHGIVLAKNYIAKKYKVKTGEPIWEAKQKCPGLIVVNPHYSLYLRFSKLARKIYENYTDRIESFGIDECWLDVTESTKLFGRGEKIAYEIKERIKDELGITLSVGVSYNKIFAKLGSDLKKPDGLTVITEQDYKDIVWKLPIEELLYVGRSTKRKLYNMNIFSIGQLANCKIKTLKDNLGKWGETLWFFANGYDDTPVSKLDYEHTIKGIGNSLTAPRDLVNDEEAKILLYVLSESVGERLRKHNLKGKTVQISIKDKDLFTIERQGKLESESSINREIGDKAYELFRSSWDWKKNIRALGVRVTDLVTTDGYLQFSLFDDEKRRKKELMDKCVDQIRERFGHYAINRAALIKDDSLNSNPVEENIIHPVSYFKDY